MFFRGVFNTDNTVRLPNVDGVIMEVIIHYLYMRKCSVNDNTVSALLQTAREIDSFVLLRHCSQYLIKNLTAANCLNVLNLAKINQCDVLECISNRFIMKNFKCVIEENNDFPTLSFQYLLEIIGFQFFKTTEFDHATEVEEAFFKPTKISITDIMRSKKGLRVSVEGIVIEVGINWLVLKIYNAHGFC